MLEYRNWCVKTDRAPQTAVNKVMRVNHFICQTLKLKPGEGPIKQKEAEKIVVRKAANDVEYYSDEELAKFFAACNHRQHLIFSTFLKSGCRREELEFLYWDDLNFKTGELHVRSTGLPTAGTAMSTVAETDGAGANLMYLSTMQWWSAY